MAIDPRAVKFHTLGNKLVEEQKYNEAIANYEKAIELAPDYAAAHYHLAEAYESDGIRVSVERGRQEMSSSAPRSRGLSSARAPKW